MTTKKTRVQAATGNRVYLVYDRKGRAVWVTVPKK